MKRPHGFDPQQEHPNKTPKPPNPVREIPFDRADAHADVPNGSEQAPNPSLQADRAKRALRDLKVAQKQRKVRERRERKRFIRPSALRRRKLVLAAASVVALAMFVGVGVLSPALNLRTVSVVGAERLDADAVAQSLSEQLGTPLALLSADEIRDALSQFSLIEEFSIETLPPHELIVRVVERRPVMSLKRGEIFDLVDAAGVVIESGEQRIPGFPVGDGLVVDVNSPAFLAAAQSLAYMQPELAAQVDVATATTDQDVTFVLGSGLTIIWGSSEDSRKKSVLVNSMLTSLAGQPISTINVSSVQAPVFS